MSLFSKPPFGCLHATLNHARPRHDASDAMVPANDFKVTDFYTFQQTCTDNMLWTIIIRVIIMNGRMEPSHTFGSSLAEFKR